MVVRFAKLTYDDLSFLNEIRNECSAEYLHDSRTFTLEETISWFNTLNPNFWIIWYNDIKIGYFRTSNYSEINKNIYVGADIHKDWRGKGLSYIAYQKFIPFLFNNFKLHKISLEVLSSNTRAINLYKKLGFIEEGRKRDEIKKNNIYVDSIIMSILEDEYARYNW